MLRPGGLLLLSQSDRFFPTKAVAMWLRMDDAARLRVMGTYVHFAGGFDPPRAFDISATGDGARDPMYIVEARKTSA